MNKPNPQEERRFDPELLKKGLRCDLDQYEMLKQCLENGEKGIKEWNEWRETNKKDIYLEGANLGNLNLDVLFLDENPVKKRCGKVYFRNAIFTDAKLRKVSFFRAYLENADFHHASLKGAYLQRAHLEGADFSYSDLRKAQLPFCTVDGSTIFFQCKINRDTWLYCVGLDNVRIEPAIKQKLECNIRRIKWEEWYKYEDWYKLEPKRERNNYIQFLLKKTIGRFWEMSDYGISTKQIIKTFFVWAIIFAAFYLAWGLIDYHLFGIKGDPGIVSNLFVLESNHRSVSSFLVPFRAIYFSIVTMTTLGFGDMYANTNGFIRGFFGHLLLALQVILGYVLLGALVTRFAVLFTAGGPAGKFADDKDYDK